MTKQKIIPHLWFDREAKEAVAFYTSIFPEAQLTGQYVMHDTPSGDCDVLSFDLLGYSLMAISAGPYFKINPAISFMINFDPARWPDATDRLDKLWSQLSAGGQALMPLDKYPFSERYGWIQDKYGVSWQLILTNPQGEERPPLIPSLLFTNALSGKTKEATDFYLSVFPNSQRGALALYPEDGPGGQKKGEVMFTDFSLAGQWFAAMDGGTVHEFGFNEAVSLIVNCDTQEEIDYYWEKLSAVPEAEQCGWCKDKYGVSWQIVPAGVDELMQRGTPEQVARLTQAFLKMKKVDLAALQQAF